MVRPSSEYDVIVVGSGAAGGMSAFVLAVHGIKVLMAKQYIDNLGEETRKGMIEKAEQANRHIILFADAADSEEQERCPELIERFGQMGITLSVIALIMWSTTPVRVAWS